MKGSTRPLSRRKQLDSRAQDFTLRSAKTHLGRLINRVIKGETVYIIHGPHRFALQHVPEMEPIPLRPPGYFAHSYTREEIAQDNRLSKASVVRAPKDLE